MCCVCVCCVNGLANAVFKSRAPGDGCVLFICRTMQWTPALSGGGPLRHINTSSYAPPPQHTQREDDGGALFMPRDAVDTNALSAAGGEVNSAITNPFFGVL